MNYGQRGGKYLSEGGGPDAQRVRQHHGAAGGYIWDAATRAGVSCAATASSRPATKATTRTGRRPVRRLRCPGLVGQVRPDYPPYDLSIPDNQRIDVWLEEFRRFEKDGNLPASHPAPRQRPHRGHPRRASRRRAR